MKTNITPEQLQALLDKLGMAGKWNPAGGVTVNPGASQQEILIKLRDTLMAFAEKDRATVLQLKEQLIRLQHGGGH